jgi:hypothetical protein
MKKKKSDKTHLVCQCCKAEAYTSNLRKTIGRKVWLWGVTKELDEDDLKNGKYQWACDTCIDKGKALIAHPSVQQYCDFDPYLAYYDLKKLCGKCGKYYTFIKEEQRYWYEGLKFWVQSKPKECAECRKEIRHGKQLNNELSELLKEKEKLTVKDMERLCQIYDEIKKPEKSKYYKSFINKMRSKE